MRPHLANKKECTGCLACIDSCKKEALSFKTADDGHIYIDVNESLCIGCKACENTCPIISKFQYSQSDRADFFAVWNKDPLKRKSSASGGAFSAIASYVLENKGIVFGVTIENICDIKHIYIDNIQDLYKLQGSKYAYSIPIGSYNKVYSFLKEGKLVLFSGTGCQVGGLLSFLKNKKYIGKLITIDIICGGVPSRFLLHKFIENEPYQIQSIKSFRTKDNGWKSTGFKYNMKVIDSNNKTHDYTNIRNLVTDGFSIELTNRYSCYKCNFVGVNRLSDFTIGDLWGDKMYCKEHYNGVSLLIAHTHIAHKLLNQLTEHLSINTTDVQKAIQHNKRIINGNNYLRFTWERKFMPYFFNKLSYGTLKKIYAYDFNKYSPWFLYKIYRTILNKIFK